MFFCNLYTCSPVYFYNDSFIVTYIHVKYKKKLKCVSEHKILSVGNLCWNVLSSNITTNQKSNLWQKWKPRKKNSHKPRPDQILMTPVETQYAKYRIFEG